jgi:RES domain-containing protein
MRGVAKISYHYRQPDGRWYRLVPSHFPTVNVFEDCYDSTEELEVAFEIEALTNDRLRQEAGNLYLVPPEEWITGPGATPIMAAFTHIGKPSRFTSGELFGVYYAADSLETAIKETLHHNAKFLSATQEGDMELTMRSYAARVLKPLVDITGESVESRNELCDPEYYAPAQVFSQQLRAQDECGIYYPSVRHDKHFNIAILKPTAISLTTQGAHYRYQWSGHKQSFIGYFKIADMHEVD